MCPPKSTRTPQDQRLAHALTKIIDRIRELERGQKVGPFDPGKWYGMADGPDLAKFEALAQLGKLFEAGERPSFPWAYMKTTFAEKKANYYADRAEAESEERRKEAGNRG